MIGTRVRYHGSIDAAWGRYVVAAEEIRADGQPLFHLALDPRGDIVLRNVHPDSVTLIPTGPAHQVSAGQLRAQVVQAEFARRYPPGSWLPYVHEAIDSLPRRVADLIAARRPVEAEAALLNGEVFAGCITRQVFQRRIRALVVAGDDESWTPRPATDEAAHTAA